MVDSHKKTFFGDEAAITIQSTSKGEDSIFLSAFGKLSDGKWEKPSQGQGKKIKLSLEEIASVLTVLKEERKTWSTYHTYMKKKTTIALNWTASKTLSVRIDVYFIQLDIAQVEIMKLLFEHILNEKIVYATTPGTIRSSIEKASSESTEEETEGEKRTFTQGKSRLDGAITGKTAKALLIRFEGGKEEWIPKSTIHSEYENEEGVIQPFLIDNWVLEKNGIIKKE
ncbi:MAG: hypothetical protein ACOC44_05450 [Promethearchaeia archaeon]